MCTQAGHAHTTLANVQLTNMPIAPATVSGRQVEILVVEDSLSDARLTVEALREGNVQNRIHHVVDGSQALSFLRREELYRDAPRPDLILLDMNLPGVNGCEVLQEIRSDPELKSLVVVFVTTSSDEKDVRAAYRLNSNAYITKPVDMQRFFDAIQAVQEFFFSRVVLPPQDHNSNSPECGHAKEGGTSPTEE